MSKKTSKFELIWFARKIKRKLSRRPLTFEYYAGKEVMNLQSVNDMIAQYILNDKPFMATRLGSSELEATWIFDLDRYVGKGRMRRLLNGMKNNTGFFSADIEHLKLFSNLMKESCGCMDLLGVSFYPLEDYVIEEYGKQCEVTILRGLEPWYVEKPWTAALKGKKVLIIHPFEKTILSQYQRRENLFPGTEIFPELKELHVLKAVQTIAGEKDERFSDWFEALEWMYKEAMKFDFEVAIIGCGAYGLPLAAKLKQEGKQAIHLGGATQLLFGIKGKRWDQHPIISKLYNEYWVRPNEDERPKKAVLVEEGCYW